MRLRYILVRQQKISVRSTFQPDACIRKAASLVYFNAGVTPGAVNNVPISVKKNFVPGMTALIRTDARVACNAHRFNVCHVTQKRKRLAHCVANAVRIAAVFITLDKHAFHVERSRFNRAFYIETGNAAVVCVFVHNVLVNCACYMVVGHFRTYYAVKHFFRIRVHSFGGSTAFGYRLVSSFGYAVHLVGCRNGYVSLVRRREIIYERSRPEIDGKSVKRVVMVFLIVRRTHGRRVDRIKLDCNRHGISVRCASDIIRTGYTRKFERAAKQIIVIAVIIRHVNALGPLGGFYSYRLLAEVHHIIEKVKKFSFVAYIKIAVTILFVKIIFFDFVKRVRFCPRGFRGGGKILIFPCFYAYTKFFSDVYRYYDACFVCSKRIHRGIVTFCFHFVTCAGRSVPLDSKVWI